MTERALDAHRPQPPSLAKKPVTPTTAFSLSSASVVSGRRVDGAGLDAGGDVGGNHLGVDLSPTASAVLGLTPGPTPPLALPAIA
jgi:hypothetical protein